MPDKGHRDKSGAAIKPWQIIVIVVALVLVLWRVGAYVGEQRRMSDYRYDPGKPGVPIIPGTTRAIKEMEK
jgi:hypothetical protein